MRRRGKLEERAEGRARMWLPPVDEAPAKEGKEGLTSEGTMKRSAEGRERWRSWSVDDL